MPNINVGKNIGFKIGSQSKLDELLLLGTRANAVEGTFYLTHDAHRLYVGNQDGSLSAVNEGVITVDFISQGSAGWTSGKTVLPTSNVVAGQFYYVTNGNILCVYNGQEWVQINNNSNTVTDFVDVETSVDSNTARIVTILTDSDSKTLDAVNLIKGENGITITDKTNVYEAVSVLPKAYKPGRYYSDAQGTICNDANWTSGKTYYRKVEGIVLSGDTYTISSATGATSGTVDIKLDSTNTTNDSSINLAPAKHSANGETAANVEITNNNGVISIAAKDSVNESLAITNAAGGGFTFTVTDNHGKEVANTTAWDPKITVGYATGKKSTVSFESGTAELDVYTREEIDEIKQGLNSMTYRGTVGTGGTAGTALQLSSDGKTVTGITGLQGGVAIGDTFLLTKETTVNNIVYRVGTLLIANSSDGTERDDGTIDPSKLTFDIVQETYITDTTYKFVENDDQDGIILKSSNSGTTLDAGSLAIKGGTATNGASLVVSNTGSSTVGNSRNEVLTITHGTVARNDDISNKTDYEQQAADSTRDTKFTIPVITEINSDSTGHITGIKTENYVLNDTNGSITSNAYTTEVNTDNTVGTITNTITFTEGSQHTVNTVGTMTIESTSLKVENAANNGLAINMVWGSFE